MTEIKDQVVASACIDDNGNELTESGLISIFNQLPEQCFVKDNHNASKPPVAKMTNFRLSRHDDGRLTIIADVTNLREPALGETFGYSISYVNTANTRHDEKKEKGQPADICFICTFQESIKR